MKKILLTALVTTFFTVPASAFEFESSKLSLGASYGLGNSGVLSLRSDYDIADEMGQPVKMRIGYDRYTLSYNGYLNSDYSWAYNIFFAGAYYDFNKYFNLSENLHPFTGLGFGFGSASCSGNYCNSIGSPSVGGFYYIGGVQYDINKKFSAEASFSAWGGISFGANYNF